MWILQSKTEEVKLPKFYNTLLTSLIRLVDILFREKASSEVLTETLIKMDKCLYLYKAITPCQNEKLLSHFAGQLYLGCATLLVKRFKEEQELWKDGIKHAQLLFLWAYGADISSQCWNEVKLSA